MSDKPKIIILKKPIKDCPHCGGKCDVDVLENQTFYVKCTECSITNLRVGENGGVTGYESADEAVDRWNSRIREIEVPDCKYCEENDGNPECPYFGEPDGCNNRQLRARVLCGDHEATDDKPYYPCKKCSNRVHNIQIPYDKKGREIFGCSRTCEMKMYEDFEDGKECGGFNDGDSFVCWP